MTESDVSAQVRELDRLYLAADEALQAFLDDPSDETQRRRNVAWRRYVHAKQRADERMTAWEQAETEHSDVSR